MQCAEEKDADLDGEESDSAWDSIWWYVHGSSVVFPWCFNHGHVEHTKAHQAPGGASLEVSALGSAVCHQPHNQCVLFIGVLFLGLVQEQEAQEEEE